MRHLTRRCLGRCFWIAADELRKHSMSDYINFLTKHKFNAVRFPLSASILLRSDAYPRPRDICGEYANLSPLAVLDDVLSRL